MELSPKAITSVDFHQVRKGYDPDEVRAFLNQLAKGVEILQTQLANSDARARAAVAKMQEAAASVAPVVAAAPPTPVATPPSADHETISRTLLLAQRTADATIQAADDRARQVVGEADERARQLVGDADDRAAAVTADAEARRAEILAAAEAEADAALVSQRARLEADLFALGTRRDALYERALAVDAHVAAHRSHLVDIAKALYELAEGSQGLAGQPTPGGPDTAVSAEPTTDGAERIAATRTLFGGEPAPTTVAGFDSFFEQGVTFDERHRDAPGH